MRLRLEAVYDKLYSCFGPQHWWPADSAFEVMLGAILTQNTNWSNAEKAIINLKKHVVLTPQKLRKLPLKQIALLIKPAGYYNIKAGRIKEFVNFLFANYRGKLENMAGMDTSVLRSRLLEVKGIGPETADSMLLYALGKPVFVVDAYTKRILFRHRFIEEDADYARTQDLFMRHLKPDAKLFNEYHALLVKLAKDFCLKNKPRCEICPINKVTSYRL